MRPLGVIVLIVLVDLLGFTLVMPLLGPFAAHYQFSEWQIGLLFSAYPVCQLVAGPILGRLSDRYGRRPLLIFSQAGTAAVVSHPRPVARLHRDAPGSPSRRCFGGQHPGRAGVCRRRDGARGSARGMGLIGMAFGLGFVLGPLLGGVLLSLPLADRLAAPAAVSGGRGFFDPGVGARSDPPSRVAATG